MRARRSTVAAVLVAALAGSLTTGLPAQAVQLPQTTIVPENPQDDTPNI